VEEGLELRSGGVRAVAGAADLGEQVARVVRSELSGAEIHGAVVHVQQVRVGVEICR
jgi:hypothetical protein